MDDTAIRALLTRLSRPHPSGGEVVERAAILAEGADFTAVVAWIVAHDGEPETAVPSVARHGLHGSRRDDGIGRRTEGPAPLRAARRRSRAGAFAPSLSSDRSRYAPRTKRSGGYPSPLGGMTNGEEGDDP